MFMNDVNKREEIRNAAIESLRGFGIKYRPKKQRHNVQETRIGRRIFKTSLHLLPTQTVTLTSGQQLVVPKVVHELCSFIMTKVETEGLFRKAGSKARQNEIRLSLDAGCCLDDSYHEIDVANVLKTFFRELPEPLFPHSYHELFLRCVLLQETKLEALLLACLLLPSEHLNILAYFMQFLCHVTEYSALNKMDAYNLAVVIGPTIFPLEEKLAANASLRLSKTCELFKLLIENANNVGFISENIINHVASLPGMKPTSSEAESTNNKKKKKRRSGSLTRVFNGLKKMVGSKPVEDSPPEPLQTPDLLTTPNISKLAKKRKMESGGFSNKKKQELLQSLPQGTALCTPVSVHPNPKKTSPPTSTYKLDHCTIREKKLQWNLSSKRHKLTKQNADALLVSSSAFAETKSALERRWSAVSQAAGFKRNRKVRYSCSSTSTQLKKSTNSPENKDICNYNTAGDEKQESDYMKISRSEYEEIKSRVSAIEERLSIELNNLESKVDENQQISENLDGIKEVQSAYEETLVKAEPLSPTTDQLARRLSRELKIRRSSEHKVIRSPSARKIGSVRRRSRENDRHGNKLQRNRSWHVESMIAPKNSLKRGKPNTLFTGLRHPSPLEVTSLEPDSSCIGISPIGTAVLPCTITPLNNCKKKISINSQTSFNTSEISDSLSSEKWTSADGFLHHLKTPASNDTFSNCRASIAKLRSQNAGMVLAKARLFDGLIDSDNSTNSQNSSVIVIPRIKGGQSKIGSIRSLDSTTGHKNNNLRYDEKNSTKKSVSPRKKNLKISKLGTPLRLSLNEKENQVHSDSFHNLDVLGNTEKTPLSVLKDCNRIDMTDLRTKTVSPGYVTPRGMPQIKRSLTVKSPKRLGRTPIGMDNKQTPLKVVTSSKQVY